MRNNVKERLSQTEDGRAIIELIESFGGWRRFTEASGLPDHYLQNWYKRGKISQEVALLLEQLPAFKESGWDKFRMVPSVSVAEWNREKRTGAAEWFKAWQAARKTGKVEPASEMDDDSTRMAAIGQNGNDGAHYGELK